MSIIVSILVIAIIIIFMSKLGSLLNSFMSWRKSAIIAGVYLLGLIACVAITAILPNDGFLRVESNDKAGNVPGIISNIRSIDDFRHQPGLYLSSRQTFKIDQERPLGFVPNSQHLQVYVEKKDVDDSKLDVLTYSTPYYVGDTDFTKLLQPPGVSFPGGLLSIETGHQTLTFKLFKPDFTQSQFAGQNQVSLRNALSTNFGETEVLLRVPKSLKIDGGAYYLLYLN